MSSGQRKRVTFADLVSARLPTDTPQTHALPRPEPGPAQGPESSLIDAPATSGAIRTEAGGGHDDPAVEDETVVDTRESSVDEPTITAFTQIHGGENLTSQSPDGSQPSDDSQPPPGSQPGGGSQSPAVRRTFRQAGGSQNDSQPDYGSQPGGGSQSHGDRQPLREVKGYLRLPNTLVDSLLPTLDVYEQAVFIQLYRLSHGFGNYTCKISLPALQARAGVKTTSLKLAVARLQSRGIVEKVSAEIGFGRDQGITYWVSQDGRQTYGDWQSSGGSQSPGDDNKRKELSKEINLNGGLTPEQIKACPDCGGVGMWYPGGPGKGVARCYHPSLRSKS